MVKENTTLLYFDTNVFDHIQKGINISKEERNYLFEKIIKKEILIGLSLLNIEEILLYYSSDPKNAKEQLELVSEITDWNHLVKYPDNILKNDIINFSNGKCIDSPYINDKLVINELRDILRSPEKYKLNIDRIINGVQEQRNNFYEKIIDAKNQVLSLWKKYEEEIPTFETFLKDQALGFTEGFIWDRDILEKCRRIGIDKLLRVKSVYLSIGMSLSLIYAQLFEKREPDIGDAFDLRHTVGAFTSNIFVTNDRKFRNLLNRIPNKPYKVTNLAGLFGLI